MLDKTFMMLMVHFKNYALMQIFILDFLNNTNLKFLATKFTSRGFKKFQQKKKLPAVGTKLTTLIITGLEV